MTVVASNYARKENDLYQTEPWATEALIRRFPVSGLKFGKLRPAITLWLTFSGTMAQPS